MHAGEEGCSIVEVVGCMRGGSRRERMRDRRDAEEERWRKHITHITNTIVINF